MTDGRLAEAIQPWLRDTHAPAFAAALQWLLPRCRTEEERALAPMLLLLLSPFNALITPCRPLPGSRINFQVTMSRPAPSGPERVRITVRARSGAQAISRSNVQGDQCDRQTLWLDPAALLIDPVGSAAMALRALLEQINAEDRGA